MQTMTSTKLTKGGQTTVPKEIRRALGIPDEGRVYWVCGDDGVAYVLAEPQLPNVITSAEQFWAGIDESRRSVAEDGVKEAHSVAASLRNVHV